MTVANATFVQNYTTSVDITRLIYRRDLKQQQDAP
jgi:hypothetical protein